MRAALADVPARRSSTSSAELDALYARYLHAASCRRRSARRRCVALLALHLRGARRLLACRSRSPRAVLIVLAALTASGVALGILHLVGLLLTVAIGSNYALFFDHLRAQPANVDDDTLASLLLANLTTVASFGLLALLEHPGAAGDRHRGRARAPALPAAVGGVHAPARPRRMTRARRDGTIAP